MLKTCFDWKVQLFALNIHTAVSHCHVETAANDLINKINAYFLLGNGYRELEEGRNSVLSTWIVFELCLILNLCFSLHNRRLPVFFGLEVSTVPREVAAEDSAVPVHAFQLSVVPFGLCDGFYHITRVHWGMCGRRCLSIVVVKRVLIYLFFFFPKP